MVKILMAHMYLIHGGPQEPTASQTHNNTQQHTTHNQKEHKTPAPWSPQAAGFQQVQFTSECD